MPRPNPDPCSLVPYLPHCILTHRAAPDLRGLLAELGEAPTAQQYEVLASADERLPSLATIRNRLGRWSEVAARLVATPHPNPTLRRLGLSAEVGAEERKETIWLAYLAGDLNDSKLAELLSVGLLVWQPSYGSPPEA